MRDKLYRLAEANGRSANSEIIARLEKSMVDSSDLEILKADVANLKGQVLGLWDSLNDYELKKPTGRKVRHDRDDPSLMKLKGVPKPER